LEKLYHLINSGVAFTTNKITWSSREIIFFRFLNKG